ncbi:hypothetical protein [Rhodoferax sp.]|uniref:hypothetical protein n=1 Tax=Rhodoferax sp. TaxID=50421 RepID=UPI0026267E92|nr:hypothetical protein [Rhodoferax sp.]MDD2919326.1 hypothetical protein [Rhodoferax sp.]
MTDTMTTNPQDTDKQFNAIESTASLTAYCRENSRVCPMPQRWSALWELLPNRSRVGSGWQPPLPLILGAWYDTPALLKMLRLAEHIKWAAEHGELEAVAVFLRGLTEDEWFHLGD